MKRIECIIRPLKLDQVKLALSEMGVTGMTVTDVRGRGGRGRRDDRRYSAGYMGELVPKVKLEVIARDDEADSIVRTVLEHAYTGESGDGKIFVLPMDGAIRIRTEESGEDVL